LGWFNEYGGYTSGLIHVIDSWVDGYLGNRRHRGYKYYDQNEDILEVIARSKEVGTYVISPNSPGIVSP
jgi:hypothetical protein